MRKGYKIVLFIGIGLVAAALLVGVIAFAVNGFRFSNPVAAEPGQDSANLIKIKKEITESFVSCRIETAGDDVLVKPSEDKTCRIEYTDRENHRFEFSVKNGTLQLIQKGEDWDDAGNFFQNIFSVLERGFVHKDTTVILYLPEKAYRSMELSTASGEILSDGTLSFENVSVSSASGDISLKGIKDTLSLTAATTSGNILVSGMKDLKSAAITCTSGDLNLDSFRVWDKAAFETVSGDILMKDADFGSISANTTSGDIDLNHVDAEDLEIRTVSGDVTGSTPHEQNFHCNTTSGDVNVPSGGNNRWTIETVSGDIDIRLVQ